MSTTPAEHAEPSTTTKAKSARSSAAIDTLNKYAEVRLAKKKQRRKAHRKTIKRSNTNG
jgi:hypothetical protein